MAVEPIPDQSVGLPWLLPEKAVAAAFNDAVAGPRDMVAQILRGAHVIAGVGVSRVRASDQDESGHGHALEEAEYGAALDHLRRRVQVTAAGVTASAAATERAVA